VAITPESLAGNITQLTSFPDVAFRINEMVADENSSAADIGALIAPDPALSAALLRIANSAMYGIGGTVSNIDRAVTVVGLREVRDLAFGICASSTFDGISNELITVEDFWKHSLFCAAASQILGRTARVSAGESLFTAGLLHDIGHLVMFNQCPEMSKESLQLSVDENDGLSPYLSERQVFGFDHMAVGAELARQWRLPENLQHSIGDHHEPFAADVLSKVTLVVHIANSLAVLAELDSLDLADAPPIDERAFKELGIGHDVIPEIVAETRDAVTDLLRIFVK
jgi:putative nucleotidyltransferase with HDIG domain